MLNNVYAESPTPSIAVSGSFYKYEYVLAPNTSIEGKDIYIAVFNKADVPINVSLGYEAPDFIKIEFSKENITLGPGGHEIIYIRIEALPHSVPGEYEVKVYANIVMKSIEGKVVLVPGAGQRTTVRIVGPTGRIIAETIDRENNHVNTLISILRITSKGEYTYASNKSGLLNISLPPGKYLVRASLAGQVLAEKEVYVEENATKRIFLVVSTVWFDYFDVLPYYKNDTIVFAEVISVLKNVYKPVNNTNIILIVKKDGVNLENITIADIPVLPLGRNEYKYRYIPVEGWNNGTYQFKLILVSGKQVYAETDYKNISVTVYEKKLTKTLTTTSNNTITVSKASVNGTITKPGEEEGFSWNLILVLVALIIIVIIVLLYKNK